MRIKIYGGPFSISYNLAKFLKRENMDVTFYTDKTPLDKSYRPDWEDEDLKGTSADWIKEVDVRLSNCLLQRRKEKAFLKELKDADILHMYGESSIWASFTNIPYIYNSYGYDLDQMPFKTNSIRARVLSYFLKRSLRKAKCVIVPPKQKETLKKLNLRVRTVHIPCPIDTDKYKRRNTPLKDDLKKRYGCEFIFLSPTRQEWTHSHTSNKGNDKVINAFGKFIKSGNKKALLVLVEKGSDLEESKKLVKRCGVEDSVMWIRPQDKERLLDFYSASDIVLDQFTLGEFGQVFLEAMSCGIPTFIYLKGYEGLYDDEPPCINVSSENEIFKNLTKLTGNPKILQDVGNKSREWILKYHDWRLAVEKYKNLYRSILT